MTTSTSSEPHDWIITHQHTHLDFVSGTQYLILNRSQQSYKIYLAPNNVELPEFPGNNIFLRTEPSHVKTIYLSGQLLPDYAILLTGLVHQTCEQYNHSCFQIKEPSWLTCEWQNNPKTIYSYIVIN